MRPAGKVRDPGGILLAAPDQPAHAAGQSMVPCFQLQELVREQILARTGKEAAAELLEQAVALQQQAVEQLEVLEIGRPDL
ncbi:hypothetical protein SDC9_179427 [bioreactor metagenome]|uniref:Uncharacterized protein n=1 Tax=bioreactor metagenome TaxID=1076179 RepID=A0A645H0W3_9ZZZZ